MKISTFLVALIMIGMFTTFFGLYYADIGSQYSVAFNNTTFAGYNQLNAITEDLAEINQTITSIEQRSGITDLLGGFLASGFDVIKITFNSFASFFAMSETAFSQQTLGNTWTVLKTFFVPIVLVLFFFAVVSILVGRDV